MLFISIRLKMENPISVSLKGKPKSMSHRANLSKRHISAQSRINMSNAAKKKPVFTDAHKNNLSVAHIGKSNPVTEKTSSSGHKGVRWRKDRNIWESRIYINGKSIALGCFKEKINACEAYKMAAIKYFGLDKNVKFTVSD